MRRTQTPLHLLLEERQLILTHQKPTDALAAFLSFSVVRIFCRGSAPPRRDVPFAREMFMQVFGAELCQILSQLDGSH